MPRCLEPGATFDVVLDSDMDKPEAERPTFEFRAQSMREWKHAKGDLEGFEAALSCVQSGLVGWRNMNRDGVAIPFVAADLESIVDENEVVELFKKVRFNERDKKKLESPHTFGPDSSALVAAPAVA